ncbi:MAG: geranylgeranylglycerol-phosphate geranylgeranyltransferase [Crocinitomicaceae bacterium]|nr:geranylgeranylglycerol-phosphate geranylgeranyltransferase [Crocinitomicaceae bacterium]
MKSIFKIIRPVNLLVIILTMYGCFFYVQKNEGIPLNNTKLFSFFILVISTLFIAAAGNIINDYFDVKADRINKPYKQIINRSLKRRWAIVLHWLFNFCGFFLAVITSLFMKSLWFVVIHLISINLLWFYSLFLKKKAIIGNMIIGFLTALVPILVILFFYSLNISEISSNDLIIFEQYKFLWVLSLFAFTQNFAREILKDIQDIKGDKLIYVRSLPMIIGIRKTQVIISLVLLCPVIFYCAFFYLNLFQLIGINRMESLGFGIACFFNILVVLRMLLYNKNEHFWSNQLIKLSMFFGLMTTFHAAFIH